MCINKDNCNCLSTPRECDAFGPFVAIDINCINTPVDNNEGLGSIIPFSSGITTSVVLSINNATGTVGSLIGFGTAINGAAAILVGNTIDLTGFLTEAFSVPRNGNITAISATFNYFLDLNRSGLTTITAQIYRAPVGSNIFTATNARVDLAPPVTGVPAGITFGSAEIEPVPVSTGDRLLMVFFISSVINPPASTFGISGAASAGINIV
ncbi:exosporium glycoprotein BclB-related protein [Lysinibacillus sp. NPDC048646]|uniref:exosporium glycoprotein BclB-related protein n=1 Tax=Lysinibacillus sp. NPDC048646 TaxID=3390574 RepID=UPI003D07C8B6